MVGQNIFSLYLIRRWVWVKLSDPPIMQASLVSAGHDHDDHYMIGDVVD